MDSLYLCARRSHLHLPPSPPQFPASTRLELTFLTADMAEMAAWLHGVEVVNGQPRTVAFTSDQPLEIFRTFVTIVMLTRSLVE